MPSSKPALSCGVDSGLIQKELGLKPTPSDEGLGRTAVWWKGRPAR